MSCRVVQKRCNPCPVFRSGEEVDQKIQLFRREIRSIGFWHKIRNESFRNNGVGINNLFDEEYIDNLRINDRNLRFFEPAPEINVYGGLSISYWFGGS